VAERRVIPVGRRVGLAVPVPRLPLGGLLGPAAGDARQSGGALALSATTSLITGLLIARFTDTLAEFTGLFMLLPAAYGLRGNVFGPLGSRLSTALRTGTLSWTPRIDTVLGQNVVAALVVSLAASLIHAVLAEVVIVASGAENPISIADFVVVSVLGGALASIVVLGITLGLAVASTRFGWDLDNVTAPLVSATGDFVTFPALIASTALIRIDHVTPVLASLLALGVLAALAATWRSKLKLAKRVVAESVPVLAGAGLLSLLAGLALQSTEERFLTFGVFLVIIPGYLSTAGALGGILAARLATKLHLGFVQRTLVPRGEARSDIRFTFALSFPIFVFTALVTAFVADLFGETSPGVWSVLLVTVSGGLVATVFVTAIAYYGTLAMVRFGLDPDNHGIPLVTACLDVVGALTLVGALLLWGVAPS
jgi:mgtE-like transporter